MTPATLLREAENELWEAVAYYETRSAGLGLDFLAVIEHALRSVRQSPEPWPLRRDGTRRFLTHRFPFLVIYTVVEGQIWVVAFAHCRRKPRYWATRQIPSVC